MSTLEPIESWFGPIEVDEGRGVEGLVVRDDEAYDALRARLPATRVQMKQPAPPSNDPLRARPPIDFGANMLVVVTRSGTMAPISIARIEARAGSVIVQFALAPTPPAARPYDVGTYAAALVARTEGDLELRGPRIVDDEAQLHGALGELVTLRGELTRTRIPSILGVDVDAGSAHPGEPAQATGWLDRDVVAQAELDERIAREGQVAHRGAGTFLRLLSITGDGLAPARRRW